MAIAYLIYIIVLVCLFKRAIYFSYCKIQFFPADVYFIKVFHLSDILMLWIGMFDAFILRPNETVWMLLCWILYDFIRFMRFAELFLLSLYFQNGLIGSDHC